jgi:predicted nucleic acid-binding protein
VAAGLTLDAGALIAAEKNSREFWAIWKLAIQRDARITLPAVVLAQAWRGNSPSIARLRPACVVEPMDEAAANRIGAFLGRTRQRDVVDAAVATGALARGDAIVTSDPNDIPRLLGSARGRIRIVTV